MNEANTTKFTEKARKTLTLAQQEAALMGLSQIGSEHLLLALAAGKDSVAAIALKQQGGELEKFRRAVKDTRKEGEYLGGLEIGLTAELKAAIEKGMEYAKELEHPYIGTEHLLLGLVCMTDSRAVGVLENAGINPEHLQNRIMAIIAQKPVVKPAGRVGHLLRKMFRK